MLSSRYEDETRRLKLIDSRKLIINPEDNLGIDVLLDREIASSKALHVVEMLKNSTVRCINSYDVIRICGDKVLSLIHI